MKEIIIKYTIDDEHMEADAQLAIMAPKLARALYEIHHQLFRPHNKNGYPDPDLNKMSNALVEDDNEDTVIDHLSEMYWQILEEYDINMETLGY